MAEINGIDLLRVKQRSVHKLFARNKIKTLKNLADLQSFCYDPNNGRTFYKHVKSFRISAPLENVWRTYKTIPPQDTWRGRMVSFGMMYSRQENHITFSNDAYAGLAPGQLIFLNLNLFANKAHLAVGHEVVDVLEEFQAHSSPSLAVARRVGGRNRQSTSRRPALDMPDGLLT